MKKHPMKFIMIILAEFQNKVEIMFFGKDVEKYQTDDFW